MTERERAAKRFRWLEWAIPALTLAMAVALVGSQLYAYIGVQRAAATVARGQAESLLESLFVSLGRTDELPAADRLRAFLDAHRSEGLKYVAVVRRDDRVEVGRATLSDRPSRDTRVIEGKGRLRVTTMMRPPGPPGPHGPPRFAREQSDPFMRPLPPPMKKHDGLGPPPPPRVVLELEPLLARELEEEAQRTFGVGVAAAVVFVMLSLFFRRVLRHRDALLLQAEGDRRLAALGEMSAVLAHEIRNPLASLKGHSQLLLESFDGKDASDRASVERIVREAVRLESLTNDLLEFVRSGRLDLRKTDPRGLVQEAVDTVGNERFNVHDEGALRAVLVDSQQMHHVLVNVLRNAAQASEAASDITVALRGRNLEIVVRDHGKGIPQGEEERIFEPFLTTRTRGTGLGLPIARKITEAHGGTITAANHSEGGAVVRITVPADGPPNDVVERTDGANPRR